MQETTLRIAKTIQVEDPLPENKWFKKYKVGSRVPKIQANVDMYHRGDYDFDKLTNIIKNGSNKPTWYQRILGFKVA